MLLERELDWPIDPAEIVGEEFVDFDLTYRGPLKGASRDNPRVDHKHSLRIEFHSQLIELARGEGEGYKWRNSYTRAIVKSGRMIEAEGEAQRRSLRVTKGGHYVEFDGVKYVPLVTREQGTICHLSVVLLRHEEAGGIYSGADIDNRLKTLFDALRIPHESNEIGKSVTPEHCYCLLEDDALITKLTIDTRRLLKPKQIGQGDDYAEVAINVQVKVRS